MRPPSGMIAPDTMIVNPLSATPQHAHETPKALHSSPSAQSQPRATHSCADKSLPTTKEQKWRPLTGPIKGGSTNDFSSMCEIEMSLEALALPLSLSLVNSTMRPLPDRKYLLLGSALIDFTDLQPNYGLEEACSVGGSGEAGVFQHLLCDLTIKLRRGAAQVAFHIDELLKLVELAIHLQDRHLDSSIFRSLSSPAFVGLQIKNRRIFHHWTHLHISNHFIWAMIDSKLPKLINSMSCDPMTLLS